MIRNTTKPSTSKDLAVNRAINYKTVKDMINQTFNYQGNEITVFRESDDFMMNATEMAKTFGKEPYGWLRLLSTKEFLKTLSQYKFSHVYDNENIDSKPQKLRFAHYQHITNDYEPWVITRKGDLNPGTFFHEQVALEFARWLDPVFAIWCNEKIRELIRKGSTFIGSLDENRVILSALEMLKRRTELQSDELKKQASKIKYYDEVLESKGVYTANQIAKELGMSAKVLNKLLYEKEIQYPQSGAWLLYHKYQDKGYTKTKTYSYTNEHGEKKTNMNRVWTEKGREFIHQKIKQKKQLQLSA